MSPYSVTWDHLLTIQADKAKKLNKDFLRHDGYKLIGVPSSRGDKDKC